MTGIIVIVLLCFLISSAWLHYLRKIDLFDKESLVYIIVTFVLGAIIPPLLIFSLHRYVFDPLNISEGRQYVHKFLYDVFAVGGVEETIKFIPVIIMLLVRKKSLNEPIDYIKYTLVSALGFAFTENIEYCMSYGYNALVGRSILAVPAHMFFSSLFVYGIVLYKYQKIKYGALVVPAYMVLAWMAHGLYDFSLDVEAFSLGILVTVMYFFVLMSLFITILNNGLNNSPFFNPKYVIDSDRLRNQLFLFYAAIVLAVVAAKMCFFTVSQGLSLFVQFMSMRLFILVVLIMRLCRFKLIQHRWNRLKFELPFSIQRVISNSGGRFPYRIRIKGDGFNEVYINSFYHEHFLMAPLSRNHSTIQFTRDAYIESKFYLKNDETFFVVKITISEADQKFAHFLLKAKTAGLTRNVKDEPIAALLSIADTKVMADKQAGQADLKFLEWVVLKKLKNPAEF